MKIEKIRKVTVLFLLTLGVSLAGCTENESNDKEIPTNNTSTPMYLKDTATISGIDQEISLSARILVISGKNNIIHAEVEELVVSGIGNTIYIKNKDVKRVVLSGMDNIIYLLYESNPLVNHSGVDNTVKRYAS